MFEQTISRKQRLVIAVIFFIFVVLLIIAYYLVRDVQQEALLSANCSNYSLSECPSSCVVCPPCPECSSISCQSEEYCTSIGFNRSWYERIKRP